MSEAPVRAGDVLAGKYRVDAVLGEGGMGIVVAAHHLHLDEKVAIKLLNAQAVAIPEVVSRFAREAKAAAKIKSEHVARVVDVGNLENGAPFLVMEFLEGQDLGQMLRRHGPMPMVVAARHVIEACEALAEAHALRIIHRDVKPANLFLANRPGGESIIKVLDFGISKLGEQPGDMSLTKTQSMVGTPLYMAVEQMTAAKDTDARADIWSLGVVLYELVSGQVPFNGENTAGVLAAMLQTRPLPPSAHRPDVTPEFDAIVLRCLQVDRAQRFPNVAELARALSAFSPAPESIERITRVLGVQGTGPYVPFDGRPSQIGPASQPIPGSSPGSHPHPPSSPRMATQVGVGPTGVGPRPGATMLETQGAWAGVPPPSRSAVWLPIVGVLVLVLGGGGYLAFGRSEPKTANNGNGIVQTQADPPTTKATGSSVLLPIEPTPSAAVSVTPPTPATNVATPPVTPPAPVTFPSMPKASVVASAPPPPVKPTASAPVAPPVVSTAAVPPSAPAPAPPPPAPRDNPLDMRPK